MTSYECKDIRAENTHKTLRENISNHCFLNIQTQTNRTENQRFLYEHSFYKIEHMNTKNQCK